MPGSPRTQQRREMLWTMEPLSGLGVGGIIAAACTPSTTYPEGALSRRRLPELPGRS